MTLSDELSQINSVFIDTEPIINKDKKLRQIKNKGSDFSRLLINPTTFTKSRYLSPQ